MDSLKRKDIYEFIGMAAIVLSLVFVIYEVRQNTAAVRSSVIQSVSDQSIHAITIGIENPELLIALDAAIEGTADDQQLRQINTYYALLLRVQKNRFLQAEIGAIDLEVVLRIGAKSTVYDTVAFRRYWDTVKSNQPEDFRQFMEDEVFSDTVLGLEHTPN